MTMTLDALVRAHGRSARDVLNERTRAIHVLGRTPEEDDLLTGRQLVDKAIDRLQLLVGSPPPDERRVAIEAAALLLAEIERLDRLVRAEGAEAHRDGASITSCPYEQNDPRASIWREGWLSSIDGSRRVG